MLLDKLVDLYVRTVSVSNTGDNTESWAKSKSLSANIQPLNLKSHSLSEMGLLDTYSGAKVMYCNPDTAIVESCRIKDGSTYYEMGKPSIWQNHYEVLLVPVQGVAHGG